MVNSCLEAPATKKALFDSMEAIKASFEAQIKDHVYAGDKFSARVISDLKDNVMAHIGENNAQ